MAKCSFVVDFEKYIDLNISVSEDISMALVGNEKKDGKDCYEFVYWSQVWIHRYQKQLEKMKNIVSFDQLTHDDLNENFPETKLDNKYQCWSH